MCFPLQLISANVELKNTEITLLVNDYKKAQIERIISLAENAKNIKIGIAAIVSVAIPVFVELWQLILARGRTFLCFTCDLLFYEFVKADLAGG